MSQPAIVIGAGIAGIATSIRLAAKGYDVTVFEANSHPGGKLHARNQDGFRFDMGPSLFTMPMLVDELFILCGEDPEDHFTYHRKKNICNYFWSDGTRFQASADPEEFARAAAEVFGESEEEVLNFLASNREKYEKTAPIFLEKSLHKLSTYLNVETLKALLRIGGMDISKSLHAVNEGNLKSKKMIQFFDRFATYNGSSPYQTPGIMSMIPHLEMDLGTYFPKGGMEQISLSLYELAKRQGVRFHLNTPVKRIIHEGSKATGIETEEGIHEATLVVSNMDVFGTYDRLLKDVPRPDRILEQERSSSALIFYWGVEGVYSELDLHNILFSDDYSTEFEHIFKHKDLYGDPTVYINITSKEETGHAPDGHENWFVMINAPGNYNQDWDELRDRAKEHILKKISQCLGHDIQDRIKTEMVWTPVEIESDTRSHRGALYGAASNSKFAAFLRHPNFKRSLKGLYFCGGSVHPGGGIPLCMYSAKIVSELVPTP